jgi:hypothetical protein
MNITVTVEELREYESKIHEWTIRRVKDLVKERVPNSFGGSDFQYREKNPLEEWMKANPIPKLIPSI